MPVALEQVFKPADPSIAGIPLVLLDFRVHLHAILGTVHEYAKQQKLPACPASEAGEDAYLDWLQLVSESATWLQYLRASWATRLNRGPDMLPRASYRVVVVDDCKLANVGYWRHAEFAEYKCSRQTKLDSKPDLAYKSIVEVGHQLCQELSLPLYRQELYEADDWAGLAHRVKKSAEPGSLLASRELYYSTVDSDWLQLVDDASRQLWANTGPWQSRLKNEAETRAYIFKRMGVRISKPADIARVKQEQGDSADDLPAGSALELFDLVRPNASYDLALSSQYASFVADLQAPEANTRSDVLTKAARWLAANCLPITIRQ